MQLWFLVGSFLLFCIAPLQATEWIRAGVNTNQPVWGIRGGLMWGLPPGFLKLRGLIRIAYPTLANGRYDLINFVAIEPIVKAGEVSVNLSKVSLIILRANVFGRWMKRIRQRCNPASLRAGFSNFHLASNNSMWLFGRSRMKTARK